MMPTTTKTPISHLIKLVYTKDKNDMTKGPIPDWKIEDFIFRFIELRYHSRDIKSGKITSGYSRNTLDHDIIVTIFNASDKYTLDIRVWDTDDGMRCEVYKK